MPSTKITWMLFCFLPGRKWLQTFRERMEDWLSFLMIKMEVAPVKTDDVAGVSCGQG